MQVFFRLVYLLPHINCLLQKLLGWFKHWIILWLSSKTVMYHLRLVIMCCICFCTIFGTNNCLYTIYFFSVATRIDEIWCDFWGLRHDFLGKKACFFHDFEEKLAWFHEYFPKIQSGTSEIATKSLPYGSLFCFCLLLCFDIQLPWSNFCFHSN